MLASELVPGESRALKTAVTGYDSQQKKRHRFSLGTSNLDAAASRAREMYRYVKLHGWEATFALYRPKIAGKQIEPTLGQFIEAIRATADVKASTLEGYIRSIRKIV